MAERRAIVRNATTGRSQELPATDTFGGLPVSTSAGQPVVHQQLAAVSANPVATLNGAAEFGAF